MSLMLVIITDELYFNTLTAAESTSQFVNDVLFMSGMTSQVPFFDVHLYSYVSIFGLALADSSPILK